MRLIRLLIAFLCLAVGVVIGALNHQPVVIDLGINVLHATLGVSVLVALLLGALIGGLAVTASVVVPLRQRLRRAGATIGNPAVQRDGF
jgi:lipopolysaccharide assembly protein A